MKARELIDEVRSQTETFGGEDIITEGWFDDMDLASIHQLRHELVGEVRVARSALTIVDRAYAAALGDDNVRFGDDLVSVRPQYRPVVQDPKAFWAFVRTLGADAPEHLFPPNSVRITAFRALAERVGIDPNVIEDTFFERKASDPKLIVRPMSQAPAYLQDIVEGERRSKK